MNISRDDLKALVRAAVARHSPARSGPAQAPAARPLAPAVDAGPILTNASVDARIEEPDDARGWRGTAGLGPAGGSPAHPSQVIIQVIGVEVNEANCLIEPAVPCTHCGYCRSYGH